MDIETPPQCTRELRHEPICEVSLAHVLIMGWIVVLCKIGHQVSFSFLTVDGEVSLVGAITHPIKSHAKDLGALLFHVVIDDSTNAFVGDLHGSWWLWVAHFFEGYYCGIGVMVGLVEPDNFSFCIIFHGVGHY